MRPSRTNIGAHLLFEHQGRVLLGKRAVNATFAASTWHLPAGCVEPGESARACAVREAAEELAVTLDAPDLELVHTVHLRDTPDSEPLIQLFFRVHRWQGEPRNNEPHKCQQLSWFAPAALPGPLVRYARTALEGIAQGWSYTEMGWAA